MCLYPKLIKNRKYMKNKKNGGNIPPVFDSRVLYVPVGCGKCIECRKQKARQWQARLHEDIRHNKNAKFVTLTFSDESLKDLARIVNRDIIKLDGYDLDNEIATIAMRRFLERWRKSFKKSVRHWFVTELGQTKTERLHLHGLLWTDKADDIIQDRWQYGHIWVGRFVNEQTINYIVKYVNKVDHLHKEYQSKILTSAGIGSGYLTRTDSERNKFKGSETIETYTTRKGKKIGLPIYYRNKIYSEEEREKLWLTKLDKEERWVLGTRVSIKDSDEEYYKLLAYARQRNRRLGYGDDSVNWERRRYERNRRKMLRGKNLGKRNTSFALPRRP